MNVETLLHEEIGDEFEKLRKMEVGTDPYKKTVDGLASLMDRAIEMEKFDVENKNKIQSQQFDEDLRLKQAKDEKTDRLVRNIISVVGIVVPVLVTVWGTKRSFEFEKEGTITTIMGRGFINKLLPKK